MDAITVSPKFQIVIPPKVRETLRIKRGQKMQVIAYNNRVALIPVRPMQVARGSLKGMDTTVERDSDDRA